VLEAMAIKMPGFAPFRTATPFLIALAMILMSRGNERPA